MRARRECRLAEMAHFCSQKARALNCTRRPKPSSSGAHDSQAPASGLSSLAKLGRCPRHRGRRGHEPRVSSPCPYLAPLPYESPPPRPRRRRVRPPPMNAGASGARLRPPIHRKNTPSPRNASTAGTVSTGPTTDVHSDPERCRCTAPCARFKDPMSSCDHSSPSPNRWNEPSLHHASPSCTTTATAMASSSQPSARNNTLTPWKRGAPYPSRPPRGRCRCPQRPPRYKSGRPHPEDRWPSGLRHTLGKRAWCNSHRGFESRPVRQHNRSDTLSHWFFDSRPRQLAFRSWLLSVLTSGKFCSDLRGTP